MKGLIEMFDQDQQSPDTRDDRPVDGPGYLYEWLANQIAARIESGDLPALRRLPAEKELATQYEVSLGTARHATRILRERGLLVTVRSKGSYVTDRRDCPSE